jgi:hypothetical protein
VQLRPIAGDGVRAEAIKALTRAHKTMIWERTRHLLRLRHALREFFPAALAAFDRHRRRYPGTAQRRTGSASAARPEHRADHRRACPAPTAATGP